MLGLLSPEGADEDNESGADISVPVLLCLPVSHLASYSV
jgi:hypothetical protein